MSERTDRRASPSTRAHLSARSGHHSPRSARESNGGGGGIRTRVRKYIPAGIYDAYPLLESRFRRREAAKNRRKPVPGISLPASATTRRQPACLNDIQSRPAG